MQGGVIDWQKQLDPATFVFAFLKTLQTILNGNQVSILLIEFIQKTF
jgi:hypothetical protein